MRPNPRNFPLALPGGTLALDLSTWTGWAYGLAAVKPVHGVLDLPKTHEDGQAFSGLYEGLCDILEWYEPRRIVAEAPLPPGTTTSNMLVWKCQIGLLAIARLAASHYGLTVREAAVNTVRSTVLQGLPWKGKQADGKPVIVGWCHDQGLEPQDHNAADAIVLLEYALRLYDRRGFARDLTMA